MASESVILIDVSRLFREGLRRIFADSTLTVVHESVSVEEALPVMRSLRPSLVLCDIAGSGDALATQIGDIRAAAPSARIVVLTQAIRVDRLADALTAGVDGYLAKNLSADALLQALRLVLLGEKVLPTDLADLLTTRQTPWPSRQPHAMNGLSDREMQILACLVKGDQNKQIAQALNISDGTVKVHLKAILKKTGAQNRTQAAIWAMDHGISRDLAAQRIATTESVGSE
jgi:two-component system, NarL family, nitrate/nitrite response regulator NarL